MGKEVVFGILLVLLLSVAAAQEIPDISTVTKQVSSLVSAMPLTKYAADGAQICLLIRTGEETFLSFDIFKEGGVVEVTPSPQNIYCDNTPANEGPEDFVIQYVDYDAFQRHVRDPSCENLKTGGAGRDFYFYPSEFMEQGGNPVCNDVFEQRYCDAVRQCASNTEMRAGGLGCCVEYGPLLGNRAFLAILIAALLGSFIVALFFILKKSKEEYAEEHMELYAQKIGELREFIASEIREGYSTRDIREQLQSIGWSDDAISAAMLEFEKQDW